MSTPTKAEIADSMREWLKRQAALLRFHGFIDCPRCKAACDTLLFGSCTGKYLVAGCGCGFQQIREARRR